MEITMDMVKELKEKCGAGILDCKNTLRETDGDIEKAIDLLRKKGMSKAAKKAGRTAKEGVVVYKLSDDKKNGLIAKINCETDFVAKTDDFKNFTNTICDLIFDKKFEQTAVLPSMLEEKRTEIVGKLGENILISEWKFINAEGELFAYSHLGKVGVIVDFITGKTLTGDENGEKLMKNIAMQITAMNPVAISVDEISAEVIEREKDIYMEEARQSGKPEKIIEKIAEGKLKKFYEENALLNQEFILDGDKKVLDVIDDYSKENNNKVTLRSFIRIAV